MPAARAAHSRCQGLSSSAPTPPLASPHLGHSWSRGRWDQLTSASLGQVPDGTAHTAEGARPTSPARALPTAQATSLPRGQDGPGSAAPPGGASVEGSCQALKLMVASAGIPGNNQSDWLFSYLVIQSPSRLSLGPSRRSPDVECVARAQTICVDGLIQAGAHLVQTESKTAD